MSSAEEAVGSRRKKTEAAAKGKGISRKPTRGKRSQRKREIEEDETEARMERKRKKPKRRSFPPSRDEIRSKESESEDEYNATSAVDSRNKRRKPKAKTKGTDSDSDYSPDVPTKKQHAQRRRRRSKKIASKENNNLAEILFAGHALAEEVESYIHHNKETLTEEEKTSMNTWVSNVDAELQKQNGVVLDNIRIVTDLRKLSRRRNQLQDQLLVQKKTNQAMKRQAESYEKQVEQAKLEQAAAKNANQFLLSLQGIARKTAHE